VYNDHYAFVPTSSALNLPLFITAPVSGCGPGISECITPDDTGLLTSRFLDATRNHEHVTFTPSIAEQVLERIPNLGQHEWSGTGALLPVDEEYNFAAAGTERTPQEITGVRSVAAGGGFLVNRNKRIRFIDDTSNPNATSAHYEVFLTGGGCEEDLADITLQSGSHFLIGEGSSRTATAVALNGTRVTSQSGSQIVVDRGSDFYLYSNGPDGQGGVVIESGGLLDAGEKAYQSSNAGKFIVDGGTLRIKSGGRLRASFSGQIIARNGGRIILEDGAVVQTWGGNVNQSDGTIWIQEGGELVIEGEYIFSGDGYWQFDKGNTVSGAGDLVIEGDGKEFRRMRLNKSAQVNLQNGQGLKVKDAKIEYDYGSSVAFSNGSSFDIQRTRLIGPATSAISTDGSARSSVENSEFMNNEQGVYVNSGGSLSAITISSSLFDLATVAGVAFRGSTASLTSFGRTPLVDGCTFHGCDKGVSIRSFTAVRISNSSFVSSQAYQFAINAQDCENLSVSESTVIGYETQLDSDSHKGAVELQDVTARFSGGEYSANTVAFHDDFGSTITFDNCVEVLANCYGIANSQDPDGITTTKRHEFTQ